MDAVPLTMLCYRCPPTLSCPAVPAVRPAFWRSGPHRVSLRHADAGAASRQGATRDVVVMVGRTYGRAPWSQVVRVGQRPWAGAEQGHGSGEQLGIQGPVLDAFSVRPTQACLLYVLYSTMYADGFFLLHDADMTPMPQQQQQQQHTDTHALAHSLTHSLTHTYTYMQRTYACTHMGGGGSGGGGRIDREPLARKPQAVHLSGIPAKDRAGRGPVIAAGAATPSVLSLCWSARVFDFDLM
ncbi:hypothetical protein PCL_03313 [Purpureocillium lilacinum]|uniref:Uncharacterized protein n=1 Tax=Purpureocillium lilacinum TaxID=33203 RepID=A0A2U3ENN6_PURLI|nr:hypothetical protein PCL_03313 [Purpureocillium lilacinum]